MNKHKFLHMKKVVSLSCLLLSTTTFSATLSLSGNYRFGSNLFSNLDLATGVREGAGNTSTFWENRFLIRPDVLIDDRFTIKTEFGLLNSNSGDSYPPEFGTALDRSQSLSDDSQLVDLRKAYLEWASDWGLLRVGRQPKSWGLGLVYDSGTDPLQDFSTTVDRVGFQALIGNLGFNIGYEKSKEGSLNWDGDDGETFEFSLDYTNPESLLEVGLLYSRNIRSASSGLGLNSSHDFSIYSTRRWGNFQAGAELATVGQDNLKSQIGTLVQLDYMPGPVTFGIDFGYASANSEGQFVFNPNYQPFLVLFKQTVGQAQSDLGMVRGGSEGASAVGNSITGSGGNGAIVAKTRFSYGFDKDKLVLGSDIGFARLGRVSSETSSNLGFEVDIHLKQQWYKNFYMSYALGTLFPGKAFGESAQTAWGFQLRGVLNF